MEGVNYDPVLHVRGSGCPAPDHQPVVLCTDAAVSISGYVTTKVASVVTVLQTRPKAAASSDELSSPRHTPR